MSWEIAVLAGNIDDVLIYLDREKDSARICSGGTDLLLEIGRGSRKNVKTIIDVSRVPGSREIIERSDHIHLGFNVTHNDAAVSPVIQKYAGALADACWSVGSPQLRNRGTIVGNIVTASPANDSIPALMVLEAQVKIQSTDGLRLVSLDQFYTGLRETVLKSNEMVTGVIIPKNPGRVSRFYKHALRKAQAISVVNAAVAISKDQKGMIKSASICLGSVAPTVVHAKDAEQYMVGKGLNAESIEEAARLAVNAANPINDIRGSAKYRSLIAKVAVKRALESVFVEVDRSQRLNLSEDQPKNLSTKTEVIRHDGTIKCNINGKIFEYSGIKSDNLLHFLHNDLKLIGTKEGCNEGECGACTVILDGTTVMSCLVPVERAHGAEITTIEGIGTIDNPHRVQQAFVEEGAVQCGYCTPGFVISAVSLLDKFPVPTHYQITEALTGNLCRCTGYYQIVKAVENAIMRNA